VEEPDHRREAKVDMKEPEGRVKSEEWRGQGGEG